jgi:xanthine/uracil permease
MESPRIYSPEDRLPLGRLLPVGLQHIVAMFGATVLAPILMGFDPQLALFFSGVITLMGVKIWLDARVDFSQQRKLVIAGASLIVATGLGVGGITIGTLNIAGIALGTVLALLLHLLLPERRSSADHLDDLQVGGQARLEEEKGREERDR